MGQCTSGLPRSEDILDTDLSAFVFVPSPQQAGGGWGMALLGPWKKMKALLDAVLLRIGNLIFFFNMKKCQDFNFGPGLGCCAAATVP